MQHHHLQHQQHAISRGLSERQAQKPQPKRAKTNPQVKQKKQHERKPWRSKVLQLFRPNLGALRLPSAASLAAPSKEAFQMQQALHGAEASLSPAGPDSIQGVGLAGVDEGPLARCLEQQGPAGLWTRDTLLHTAAMFLYGSVPQALRNPPPTQQQQQQQQQQQLHHHHHHQQQQQQRKLWRSGAGTQRGGLLQQLLPGPLPDSPADFQVLRRSSGVPAAARSSSGADLLLDSLTLRAASTSSSSSSGSSSSSSSSSSSLSQLGRRVPLEPVLPWGGFGSVGDPLAQATEGLVGPDWLYDLPPPGKGSNEPGAMERLEEVEERVREAWCPARLDMPPRGSLEALLLHQVASEQQTPLFYEPELPPGCDPSTWPLTPTSLLKVPRGIYKQGSLLRAPRLPKLKLNPNPQPPSRPPPPGHVFWAVSEQDLTQWMLPDRRQSTRKVQLLLNRMLGMLSDGPSDSLGVLVGSGKPIYRAPDSVLGAATGSGMPHNVATQGGAERRGTKQSLGVAEGPRAGFNRDGARGRDNTLIEGGIEGQPGGGLIGSGMSGGEDEPALEVMEGEELEEGAGPAAVRATVQALRTTLRQKYVSSVQIHVYAPRSLLDTTLGPAIIREGALDMDLPYYMLAAMARNQRLFGRRRRLWREWAARQGPQYRYLERFRDPWREAKEEVEHQASMLLLGPASRDYPAALAHVHESDLLHAAQEGRMPLNWRRRHWRQQQRTLRQRDGLGQERLQGTLGAPGTSTDGHPSGEGASWASGIQRSAWEEQRGGVSSLGTGSEEALVLQALRAYRDLLGRPQRGSPGRLVYRTVTLQQVLQNLSISVHPCSDEAYNSAVDHALHDMQACLQAQGMRQNTGQQAGISLAIGLPPSHVAQLPSSHASQVHAVVMTDDPAVQETAQGRAGAVISWLSVARGDYLPGSRVA